MRSVLPFLILLIILQGCIYSNTSFIPENNCISDERFSGTWISTDNKEPIDTYYVSLSEKLYNITIISSDEEKAENFEGSLTKIENRYYASIGLHDFFDMDELFFVLVRIKLDSDLLQIQFLEEKYLNSDRLKKTYNLEILNEDDSLIQLTSDPNKLYRFLLRVDKDQKAWGEPKVLKKIM